MNHLQSIAFSQIQIAAPLAFVIKQGNELIDLI